MKEFQALFKKNFIIWKRNRWLLVIELMLFLVFGGLLGIFNYFSEETSNPTTMYLDEKYVDHMQPNNLDKNNLNMAYKLYFLGLIQKFNTSDFQSDVLMKNCLYNKTGSRKTGGYVALSPKNWMTEEIAKIFDIEGVNPETNEKMTYFKPKFFDTEDAIQKYVQQDGYGDPDPDDPDMPKALCFGISIKSLEEKNITFDMHYNLTGNPSWFDTMEIDKDQIIKYKEQILDDYHWINQVNSGFGVIQQIITQLALFKWKPEAKVNATLIKAPINAYKSSNLFSNSGNGDFSFFISFPLFINFYKFINMVVSEKEKRITQNLRNMGMSLWRHYLAWISFNTLVLFGYSLLWSILTKVIIFAKSSMFLIFLTIFLPALALQSAAVLVSALFIKAKTALITGAVIQFAFSLARTAKQAIQNPSDTLEQVYMLSPESALSCSSSSLVFMESYSDGLGFGDISDRINGTKYIWFIQGQVFTAIVLLILGLYIEQVIPSELGVRKGVCFCLCCCSKKKKRTQEGLKEPLLANEGNPKNYEVADEALAAQTAQDKTLLIKNLKKQYSNGKVAVDGLNLEMYTDQIFALLGHNGAGKTTTISMISGLIAPSKGSISMLGRDTVEMTEANKKYLGVCPQTNPIYDNLTCYEHLVLYSVVKARPSDPTYTAVTDSTIDRILQDLDLLDKKDYLASKLSGGQKRKLCVAIAFIGDSQVILLDEPTSGMDTYARRYLWEMVKAYKKDRIIILSTHYMDEADYLGDRIGIMGKGKLITCGSSLFLKKRFGAGYDLTIVKNNSEVNSDTIEKVVTKAIPSAIKAGDISMEVKFQLPSEDSASFEALFKELEDKKDEYGIQTYGISLTTLEEVFLKVARLDEEDLSSVKSNEEKINKTIRDENFELKDIQEKNKTKLFFMHFWALCMKRYLYFKRDKRGLFCEIILPVITILIGMVMTKINFVSDAASGPVKPDLLGKSTVWVGVQNKNSQKEVQGLVKDYFEDYKDTISLNFTESNSLKDYNELLLKNYDATRFYSVYIDKWDKDKGLVDYQCIVNTTAPFDIQLCQNLMNNVAFRYLTSGSISSLFNINVVPFLMTKQVASFENTATGFVSAILISIAFAFIPTRVVTFIVNERENNAKHQQLVSGVSRHAYWLSNLLIDFLKYMLPGMATVGIMALYSVDVFVSKDALSMTLLLFVLFGPAMLLATYLMSFGFKSPSKAQFFVFMINYLGGVILTVMSFILRLLKKTRWFQLNILEFILRLFPTYDLAFGLFSMANGQLWQMALELDEKPGPWSTYCGLYSLIYLIVLPFIFYALIMYVEQSGSKLDKLVSRGTPKAQLLELADEPEDEDVRKEKEEVKNNKNYAVRVYNLMIEYVLFGKSCFQSKKVKSTKLAVKGVSFGVQNGECFGLLGTNGAGKTSTFKVLSGEVVPNVGEVSISGLNVETDMAKIGNLIGYCPQFDALLDNLTAKEHLELYAAIKGIPVNMREQLIENKLLQLNLDQYRNVQAGTYSGGNKRKLSVAIALLGNPSIILLDEPSSGMDPEARRFMWSIVSQISTQNKKSSVILTTHSMEEAEALSSKLAIMVEGKVRCIGPVQQLKSKFGKGFEIEIKVEPTSKEETHQLEEQIPKQYHQEMVDGQESAIAILRSMGFVKPEFEFCPNGKCSYFATQFEKGNSVTLKSLVDFMATVVKSDKIQDYLTEKFTDVTLLESMNLFFRFKIENNVKLSSLFGAIEPKQKELQIAQYSVKQTTIEQIFINFANTREEALDD